MRLLTAFCLSAVIAAPAVALNVAGSRPAGTSMVMPLMRTVSAERAAEIKSALGREFSQGLDPQTVEGRRQLAAIEAGFNTAAAAEILDQVDAIVGQNFYADDAPQALQDLASGVSGFVGAYHHLLSGTQVMKLTQFAEQARQASQASVMASANGIAQKLGIGRSAEEVSGAESAAAAPLAKSVAAASVEAAPAAVPLPSAVVSADDGKEPEKGFNWFMTMVYSGAVLIMGAFGWFVLYNWMILGPGAIMILAAGIAGGLALLGRFVGEEKFPKTAGLINATIVGMAPLFTYGLLAALGKAPGDYSKYYTHINLGWVWMELATIAAAAAMAFFGRAKSAMVAFPAAIAAWFLSMDLARAFTGHSMLDWQSTHAWFSVVSGMVMMAAGRLIEKITKVDYSFWAYLAGLLAFSGGLAMLPASNEIGRLMFALVHVGLIGAGVYLKRKTFAVFGAIGAFGYIGHLAALFAAELSFPFALAFFGVGLIVAAVAIQKNMPLIKAWIKKHLESAA